MGESDHIPAIKVEWVPNLILENLVRVQERHKQSTGSSKVLAFISIIPANRAPEMLHKISEAMRIVAWEEGLFITLLGRDRLYFMISTHHPTKIQAEKLSQLWEKNWKLVNSLRGGSLGWIGGHETLDKLIEELEKL